MLCPFHSSENDSTFKRRNKKKYKVEFLKKKMYSLILTINCAKIAMFVSGLDLSLTHAICNSSMDSELTHIALIYWILVGGMLLVIVLI